MRRVVAALGWLAVLVTAAGAEGFPLRGVGRPGFLVDMVTLPGSADSADVEVTWEVPLRDLAFRPEDDVQRARYEVAVVFLRNGAQVHADLWERRVRAQTPAETRDPQKSSRGRRTVRLALGKYDVRVSVTDRVSGARSEGAARLELRTDREGIGLSDLRLVRYTESGIQRNTGHDVPVGESGHFVRATLRTPKGVEGEVTLRWRVLAPGGVPIANRDSLVALRADDQIIDLPLPTELLAAGEHEIEVRLGTTGRAERRRVTFRARLTPAWFAAHREDAIDILRLLSEPEDLSGLEAAEDEAWPDSLNAFWIRNDPSPDQARNEFVERVQERVEESCTLFVEPFRHPGWKTDRGRIWVRLGRPDRRTTNSGDIDRPATEVWEYDAPRRVFVFVDRGSGEYWLSG